MNTSRFFLAAGALAMALGVALGAYGAHAAKGAAHPEAVRLIQTAVLYQLVHGLGMLAVGILARTGSTRWLVASGALMLLGVFWFCGSLWWLALTTHSLGPLAPLGGLSMIAGWIALAVHAILSRQGV
ncbi:hypothetical protein BWI17_00925 [Betaproteobacteria bacterium GR16-43]|nr:hypothetical protein BWI17_00925 [Betaproteobacteria bacterium GR16-43]